MKENEIADKIFDFDFAEPLFHFVEQRCFDDFCEKNAKRDLSIAEYVYKYKLQSFGEYCKEIGII